MQIFEAFLEIEPLDECDLVAGDAAGAVTYIYLSAEDLESAVLEIKHLLYQDKLQLIGIDYIRTLDLEEWEAENNMESPSLSELQECLINTSHLYSAFHSYLSRHEH